MQFHCSRELWRYFGLNFDKKSDSGPEDSELENITIAKVIIQMMEKATKQ